MTTTLADLQPCWAESLVTARMLFAVDGGAIMPKEGVHDPTRRVYGSFLSSELAIWLVSPADYAVLRASAGVMSDFGSRIPGWFHPECKRGPQSPGHYPENP